LTKKINNLFFSIFPHKIFLKYILLPLRNKEFIN
jgi:hypothetical protein